MADQPDSSGGSTKDAHQRLDEMSQLVSLHGQQLEEILRLLRAQTVPVGPVVTEEVRVQTEVVPPTPTDDMSSTLIDTSIRATAETRQAREFMRHHPEKFHGGTDLEAAEKFMRSHEKIHDVLATPAHMQPSISSALLFGEADIWWRTMVASKGKPKNWAEFKERFERKYIPPTVRNLKRTEFQNIRQRSDESVMQYMDRYLRLMEYAGGAANSDSDQAYYFVHGLLDSIGAIVVTTAPSTLQEAYERAMASEGFVSTRTREVTADPVSGLDGDYEDDDLEIAAPPTRSVPTVMVSHAPTNRVTRRSPQGAQARRQQPYSNQSGGSRSQGGMRCYQCRQPGHIAIHCPQLASMSQANAPLHVQERAHAIADLVPETTRDPTTGKSYFASWHKFVVLGW
ncbi:hypothetical protein Sjap_001145 [Stephania japonica]|uniref:CCHC-type domain-containing protein n=1 Tax=Stephania japonica TaxID=461633 RepID=A0AAP0KKB7_9MAGN